MPTGERHRRDVAECAREAAYQAQRSTDVAHRRLAGTAAQPLRTALKRAGLHVLADAPSRLERTAWVLVLRRCGDRFRRQSPAGAAVR